MSSSDDRMEEREQQRRGQQPQQQLCRAVELARCMHADLSRALLFMSRLQGLPAPPGKPLLIPGEEDEQPDVVGIRWERSPASGGSAIIGYHVEQRKMGSPHWVRSAPVLCTFPELTLSGLEPGWRYQFRIRAQNALGLSEPSELSDPLTVTLQRTATMAPRFEQELGDCVAREGGQAEFTVMYAGTPLPKVSWYKDGFEIFSSRRTTIVTDSMRSVLIIQRTSIDDEGEIKCSATNRAGHISTRGKLIVEAPPHVRLPRQYDEGLLFEQGETIRLKATNGGRPPPSITWYHNGEIIVVDQRHHFESITDNETILKIQDAKRQDRGEYSIRAINKLGEDVASFLVTVTDRPAAPGKAVITGTLGRDVTLSWKEPDDDGGCRIGIYIVEYYRLGWDVWLKAATSRQPTATLNDLIEGSEYRFRVKAENPYGLSEPSEESDVVFIPDPKRGIIEPNMRAKSASQRDIPRGRSERRELAAGRGGEHQPAHQRTRSLTREEASSRVGAASGANAYERSASSQRLHAPPVRPSRADSRVTFALDTTSRERDEPRRQWSKELLPQPGELETHGKISTSQPMAAAARPAFSDSGGERSYLDSRSRSVSYSREQSPSASHVRERSENCVDRTPEESSPPRAPPRRRSSSEIRETTASLRSLHKEDEERMLHDSTEFMLLLCPDGQTGKVNEAQRTENQTEIASRDSRTLQGLASNSQQENRMTSETHAESEDEDLYPPPPLSRSLPELFSADHQIIEIFREAVSSTELLHERAMERFYRAVEAEESIAEKSAHAKSQPLEGETSAKRTGDNEHYPLFSARTRQPVRRRLSNSGGAAWQLRRDRRRSSEGQAKMPPIKPSGLAVLGALENATSDPNLRASEEVLAQKKVEPWVVGGLDDSAERLRRWHETGIDLSNEDFIAQMIDKENSQNKQKEEMLKQPELQALPELNLKESTKIEEEYDEVAPDTGEILAEDSVETSGVSSEEESTDSEDIKQLKARIMAIPVIDENDTYHPRGRMILQMEPESPPPVPPHRVPAIDISPPIPDRANLSPTNLTPTPSSSPIVPKSILKKRTDTDVIPVNQFGRPIPPEKPLRKSLPAYDDDDRSALVNRPLSNVENKDTLSDIATTIETSKPKLHASLAATSATVSNAPDIDKDEEAVISAGEAAVSKRKQMRQGPKTTLPTEDTEQEQEETLAVVNHYTEIVRQCSRSDFRQRSLSQDKETKYYESPSESRVSSPIQNQLPPPNSHKERLPVTPGKTITSISPSVPLSHTTAKIITPIPPVMPTTVIHKAKPIEHSRRGSLTNRNNEMEREIAQMTRGRSRNQDHTSEPWIARMNNLDDSRSPTPTGRRSDSRPTSRNESRPDSRSESPMYWSRNMPRERESRSTSTAWGNDTRSSISGGRRSSRTSSRPSSRDRSRASTPTEAKIERLQRALDDKQHRMRRVSVNDRVRELETKRKVRSIVSYFIDVGLLIAAFYVYLFDQGLLAIPLIVLLMYRYIQEEVIKWIPARWRHQNQKR